jgi:hypothetical protein
MSFELETDEILTDEILTDEILDLANFNNLNYVRETIESMTKFNQVEILRILTKNKNVTINENKYGIHINLSELNSQIIAELIMYINYVNTQEIQLNQTEQQKESFKNIYFVKDIRDNNKNNVHESSSSSYSS